MPYMIYQQYKSAIAASYRGADNIDEMYAWARECRMWLASLKIDPKLRDPLVEQISWIEEGFKSLVSDEG